MTRTRMIVRILIHAFFSHVRKYIVIKVLAVTRHSFDTEIGSANLNADLVWKKTGATPWNSVKTRASIFLYNENLFDVPNF